MEINAKVYAVAKDEKLLGQVHEILNGKTYQHYLPAETLEPCAVLPLSQTWYGFTERAEPTNGPEGWLSCLRECAGFLRKDGAVVIEFRSPDHPDSYLEYAYTTSGGNAGSGSRPGLIGYHRAGCEDLCLAMDEMFSERTAQERMLASRRKEKKEALRQQKGDFEITPDGVLKKYRGNDIDVIIPDGVREIGESAFVDMKGLERMIMECEDYDAPEMETLTIPDSVTKIQSYAFAYCTNLEEVNIPDSVVSIGERAFEGCESLKSVCLPAGLTEIEEFTFFLCENLRTVKIPDGVVRIGKNAFDGTDLRKVKIPESVKEIGEDAFPVGTRILKSGDEEPDEMEEEIEFSDDDFDDGDDDLELVLNWDE